MSSQLELPFETVHSRRNLDRSEWRIRWFVEHDAYVMYDYWITTRDIPRDIVARDHLRAINNAMRARARLEPWHPFLGEPLPELNAIAPDLDLIASPDCDVEDGISALRALCARITSEPFITDMAFSKVFHLLRPRFVPISDSYVRLCLGVPEREPAVGEDRGMFYSARLERVVRGLRQFGRANSEAVERLKAFADNLPPIEPEVGAFRGRQIPVRLSRVRLLDILLWTEAIYGRTPHAMWREAHRQAFGAPGAPPNDVVAVDRSTVTHANTAAVVVRTVNGVDVFKDDDTAYLEWLSRHPRGLVLNCERLPRPNYLMLHRASCRSISGTPARGLMWTGPYIKVCAMSRQAVAEWASNASSGTPQSCKLCQP